MALQTATNPQTGESVALVGNQWVPITQTATNPKTGAKAYLVNNEWMVDEVIAKPTTPTTTKPEPKPESESIFRQVADVPLSIAKGATQGVRMIADAFGAGSETSKNIKGAEDYLVGLMSAQSKNDSKEIARIMKEAEDKGVLENVKAAFKAFTVAPVDLLTSALGTSAPTIIAALGATFFAPAAAVGTVAGATALGLGAVMGAGTVKGTIYEETKRALKEAGIKDEKQIEEVALKAQEYGGKNLDMILAGAGLGALAGRTGAERQFIDLLSKRILTKAAAKEAAETVVTKEVTKEVAKEVAKKAPKTGIVAGAKKVVTEAGKEAVPEFAQAGQEKLAENIALQRVGEEEGIKALAETPTMRGVVGAATLEALAGAALGGSLSVREAIQIARGQGATDKEVKKLTDTIEQRKEPEIKTEAAPPERKERTLDAEITKEQQIDALTQQLVQTRGMAEEDARKIATMRVNASEVDAQKRADEAEEERKAKLREGLAIPDNDPRVQAYAGELLDNNIVSTKAEAIALAKKRVADEEIADAESVTVPPVTGSGKSVTGPPITEGGESVSVPSRPDGGVPTEGAAPSIDAGVDGTELLAKPSVRGEEASSGALETRPAKVTDSGAYIPSTEKGKDPLASAAFRTIKEDDDIALDDESIVGATLITGMQVQQRNAGLGSKLLNSVLDWADSNGKTLVLIPAAEPDAALGGLNQEQLKSWYARNNFEDRVDYMVRKPQQAKETPQGAVEKSLTKTTRDTLYDQAKNLVIESQQASISLIRRRLSVGYNRAQRILEQLEAEGVVSAKNANLVRSVLVKKPTPEEEVPSVIAPTETVEAEETRAATPVEGAEVAEPAAETPRSKAIKRLSELTEEARKLESDTFTGFANEIDPEVNKEAIAGYADKERGAATFDLYPVLTGNGFTTYVDNEETAAAYGKENKLPELEQVDFKKLLIAPTINQAKVKLGLPEAAKMSTLMQTAFDKGYDGITFSTTSGQQYLFFGYGRPFEKVSPSIALSGAPVNERLSKVSNAVQGLTVVAQTGDELQKALANRFKSVATNVPVVVLEQNTPLPKQIADNEAVKYAWDVANAMYVGPAYGQPTIYLRGASFGDQQSINNVDMLHESSHAALDKKLITAENMAETQGVITGVSKDPLVQGYTELKETMMLVQQAYDEAVKNNTIDPQVLELGETLNVFNSPREFAAYGTSNPYFVKFLKSVKTPARYSSTGRDKTLFTKFVEAVRKILGLAPNQFNALSDLFDITDRIASMQVQPAQEVIALRGRQLKTAKERQEQQKPSLTLRTSAVNQGQMPRDQGTVNDLSRKSLERRMRHLFDGYEEKPTPKVQTARRLQGLIAKLDDGSISPQDFEVRVRQLAGELDEVVQTKASKRAAKPRQRGEQQLRERLIRAQRQGDLKPETVAFAFWALDQNPALATNLAISIQTPKSEGTAGQYNPTLELMRLFKGSDARETAVHELLHHAERMMPKAMQEGIRQAWAQAYTRALEVAGSEERQALSLVPLALAGDRKAQTQLEAAILDGPLNYADHYQLVNPSEYWAVNASALLARRFDAKDSIFKQIAVWLSEMMEKVKGILGLKSDAPLLKALKQILDPSKTSGKGKYFLSSRVLRDFSESETTFPNTTLNDLDRTALAAKKQASKTVTASNEQVGDGRITEPVEVAGGKGEGEQGVPGGAKQSPQGVESVGLPAGVSSEAAERRAARTQKEIDNAVAEAVEKYETSKRAENLAKQASLIYKLRNGKNIFPALAAIWRGTNYRIRQGLVKPVTNAFLAEWAGKDIPRLLEVNKQLQQLSGMAQKLMGAAADLSRDINDAFRADPTLRDKIDKITKVTTDSEIDPTSEIRSELVNKMFEDLGPKGRRLYNDAKQYYEDMAELYSSLLDDQINEANISPEAKSKLLASIKKMFEGQSRINPYFPLMRDGDFWLSVYVGNTKQFFMFPTMAERDAVAAQMATDRKDNLDNLLETKKFEIGNDLRKLREASTRSINGQNPSAILKATFDLIDNANFTDLSVREDMKDAVYQLYLRTMPEQSFRKQFITRKGYAGYRTDFLRDFNESSLRMSLQLARLKYAPKLRNTLSAARESIENRPELEPFMSQMEERVAQTLNPNIPGVLDKIASFVNKASFIYYLSGASSALLQPLGIIQTGIPILGARHGYGATAAEMAKLMKVWDQFGIMRKTATGSSVWSPPSIMNASGLTADERTAVESMLARDVTQNTYARALFDYKNVPTEEFGSVAQRGKHYANMIFGGLIHSTERISREILFLASYRLSKRKNPNISKEDAIDQAVQDTNDALGNYGEYNRPMIMRNAGGKIMLQFQMYPLHVTLYLLKNFKRMIPFLNKEGKVEAAKIFWGTMASTWMLAGAAGLPMFSAVMGLLGLAWNLADDDEKPKDIKGLDFELWARTMFLPEVLGGYKINGKSLSDIIERGPLNAFTDLDFASRTQLNDLWFRDIKETKTPREELQAYAIEKAGPSVNMILNWADAYEAFANGDYQKGVEKLSPALIRNFVLTHKYATEGAKDNKGDQIMSKDAFTTGELIGQAIGFRSDLLANTQNVTFKLIGIQQRIKNERQKLFDNIDREYRNKNFKAYNQLITKDLVEFNKKYPSFRIEVEQLQESLERRAKDRGESWRGLRLSEKNAALLAPAAAPSRKAVAERERLRRIEVYGTSTDLKK